MSLVVSGFKSSPIFSEIQEGIKGNEEEIIKEFNSVLQFDLKDSTGKLESWTLDFKKASVYKGKAKDSADCTLILSDENCFGLMNGTIDGTELFFDGELKIKGDMSLAMKLSSLKDHRSKSKTLNTSSTPSASAPSTNVKVDGFKSSEIFQQIADAVLKNPEVGKDFGGVLEFALTNKDGKKESWTLIPSPPSMKVGKAENADAVIIMKDEDCVAIMTGKTDATELFFDGALKIKGDMSLAMKLSSLKDTALKPNPTSAQSIIVPGFKSSNIFAEIEAGIKENPQVLKEFDAVYEFALSSEKGKQSFTVDLKTGKVTVGKTGNPDCTLIMTDNDCFDIMSGGKDATELFFDGALKIKGDMSLAMKLSSLKDYRSKSKVIAPSSTPVSTSEESGNSVSIAGFKSSAVFDEIQKGLKETPSLVKEFEVIYEFKLTNSSGKTQSWTVDLKDGKVMANAPSSQADCQIIMTDEDCFAIMTGKADATELFFDGALKVKGDMSLAMKLSTLKEKGIKSKL
eukprot:gene2962-4972_t